MTNADRFHQIFGLFATEVWAFPEKEFLNWLNSEPPELTVRALTRCEKCMRYDTDNEKCTRTGEIMLANDFCSMGTRRK